MDENAGSPKNQVTRNEPEHGQSTITGDTWKPRVGRAEPRQSHIQNEAPDDRCSLLALDTGYVQTNMCGSSLRAEICASKRGRACRGCIRSASPSIGSSVSLVPTSHLPATIKSKTAVFALCGVVLKATRSTNEFVLPKDREGSICYMYRR